MIFIYLKLKGSDYSDKGSFDPAGYLSDNDLSYIDDSGATVSIIEIGDKCCKPIRIKCQKVKKNKEKCVVSKGNIWSLFFLSNCCEFLQTGKLLCNHQSPKRNCKDLKKMIKKRRKSMQDKDSKVISTGCK